MKEYPLIVHILGIILLKYTAIQKLLNLHVLKVIYISKIP